MGRQAKRVPERWRGGNGEGAGVGRMEAGMGALGGDAVAETPVCLNRLCVVYARDHGGMDGGLRRPACEVARVGDGLANAKPNDARSTKVDGSVNDRHPDTRGESLHGSWEH